MARQLFPRAGTAGGLRGAVVHRGLVLRDGALRARPRALVAADGADDCCGRMLSRSPRHAGSARRGAARRVTLAND